MSKIKLVTIFVILATVLAAITVFAGCRKMAEDVPFVNDVTENILISMNNVDYANFSKDFDDTIKVELTEATFPEFVSAITGSNGNYKAGSKKLTSINVEDNLISVSYLVDFEDFKDVTFEVTFKEIGDVKKVVGLWFLGPSTNLFIGTTSNNL